MLSNLHKGRKLSDTHRKRISIANIGKPSHRKGKHLSYEIKKKISISRKGKFIGQSNPFYGKHHTKESRQAMSDFRVGKTPWNKGVSFNSGEKHPNWIGGVSFEPYCYKFNKILKEQIRKRDDRACQLCCNKENGRKLSIHHIHYDKQNCEPDLISLCAGCNSKVNYNRDYYEKLFIENLKIRGLI